MIDFLPNPIIFSIPLPNGMSVPISWHGVIVAFGALLAVYVATFEVRRRGENPEHISNALMVALLLGVVGSRLYHIISDLARGDPLGYLRNPLNMVTGFSMGLGILGGVAGGKVTDRTDDGIERFGLDRSGNRPATDQQQRRGCVGVNKQFNFAVACTRHAVQFDSWVACGCFVAYKHQLRHAQAHRLERCTDHGRLGAAAADPAVQ